MQDRFKFRVWEKDQKIMKECTQITLDKDQTGSMCDVRGKVTAHLIYQPHYILMQCTGLKDKNGKLIYEGDVVRLLYAKDDYIETRQVVYDDCAFQFNEPNSTIIDKPLYCFAINYLNHYKHIELEVIGNIYENPELLRGQE